MIEGPFEMRRLLICAALGLALGACDLLFPPTEQLRYRLTVEMKIDDTTKTESSVFQASYYTGPSSDCNLDSCGTGIWNIRGSAITFDLGAKGLLFVTLADDDWANPGWRRNPGPLCGGEAIGCLPFNAYRVPLYGVREKRILAIHGLRERKDAAELRLDDLPLLIRFRNLNDPKSTQRVDPHDLANVYGPGAAITRATVTMTTDPVSSSSNSLWPQWLQTIKTGEFLGGGTSCMTLSPVAHCLQGLDFKGN